MKIKKICCMAYLRHNEEYVCNGNHVRCTYVWAHTLLLDILEEGRASVNHCFKGILTAWGHTLVRVQQYSQLPVCLVDFLPMNTK